MLRCLDSQWYTAAITVPRHVSTDLHTQTLPVWSKVQRIYEVTSPRSEGVSLLRPHAAAWRWQYLQRRCSLSGNTAFAFGSRLFLFICAKPQRRWTWQPGSSSWVRSISTWAFVSATSKAQVQTSERYFSCAGGVALVAICLTEISEYLLW